jgi:hypothetical protein
MARLSSIMRASVVFNLACWCNDPQGERSEQEIPIFPLLEGLHCHYSRRPFSRRPLFLGGRGVVATGDWRYEDGSRYEWC